MQERVAPRARVPCAALHVPSAARFLAAQGRAGQHRERALRGQAPRALRGPRTVQRCSGKAHTVPRLAGKARGAAWKRNNRGRNDGRRIAKTRNEPMRLAWAGSCNELRL